MTDELVKRLRDEALELHGMAWRNTSGGQETTMSATLAHEAADRIEQLTADFARQVQRTDEQREAYEQALSVMEAERDRLRAALNQSRLAFAGHVSVQSAIDLIDRAALKGESHD